MSQVTVGDGGLALTQPPPPAPPLPLEAVLEAVELDELLAPLPLVDVAGAPPLELPLLLVPCWVLAALLLAPPSPEPAPMPLRSSRHDVHSPHNSAAPSSVLCSAFIRSHSSLAPDPQDNMA